jgi:hypothetical protein
MSEDAQKIKRSEETPLDGTGEVRPDLPRPRAEAAAPDLQRNLWSFVPYAGWRGLVPMQSAGYESKLVAYWFGSILCGSMAFSVEPTIVEEEPTVVTIKYTLLPFGEPPLMEIVSMPKYLQALLKPKEIKTDEC